jgi:hypothetical protein
LRCQRVFFSILRCLCFRIFLRRFFTTELMRVLLPTAFGRLALTAVRRRDARDEGAVPVGSALGRAEYSKPPH